MTDTNTKNPIYLFDTHKKSKVQFVPLDNNKIRLYGCGPTVYDRIHVGNARSFVVYDLIFRLLRHIYGENNVIMARNITDVDDKINNAAMQKNISINELTTNTTAAFHEDMLALSVLNPTFEPKATEHIDDIIIMIKQLIKKKHAYVTNNHVMFDVSSFHKYGSLSGRELENMKAGARVEINEIKHNSLDFVLWKPSNNNQVGWDSIWGYGRPGWHIECSAIASKFLGKTFDLHLGGNDLIFPHHENEYAQSCCCYDTSFMSKHWVHIGFVKFSSQKMSKSLGNTITVQQALTQVPGDALRFALLSSHYRHPMIWNDNTLNAAYTTLQKWYNIIKEHNILPNPYEACDDIICAICNDLNTPKAITKLHYYYNLICKGNIDYVQKLANGAGFLGLISDFTKWEAWQLNNTDTHISDEEIADLLEKRCIARSVKDFDTADQIRNQLLKSGININDDDDKSTWYRIK